MKIEPTSFRGMAPRVTPRALPANAARDATNARLQTGDLEAWRQFALTKTLANAPPVESIYLLNDKWLSWGSDVDVARSTVSGDTSFRAYLTGPDEYAQPRFTNYALATTGSEPFPVTTRPLGVPAPESAPTLEIGVDPSPTTFSVDVLDEGDALATSWTVSSPRTGSTYATVTQSSFGGDQTYLATYDENHNQGEQAFAYRNFGVANALVVIAEAQFAIVGDTSFRQAILNIQCDQDGNGVQVRYQQGVLYILQATAFSPFGVAQLATVAAPGVVDGVFHTLRGQVVTNSDGTKTVTAELSLGSAQIASVVATNTFGSGDYCGISNGVPDDSGSQFQTHYTLVHVQASGSTNYTPVNVATSYVYTFVNDLGQESAPSPASATILRPDGISVTVTTPTAVPSGVSVDYGINVKRIYRAVTGSTGTIFRFVAEVPLATAGYVDVLTDSDLGEALQSELWALPPDDLKGILALPNGVMVGFRANQVCFSAQNQPHAWPVEYRLNTDTTVVGIGNIDNTVVIGTESFPYLATGNDPAAYSMSKLEAQQACVSKQSVAYVLGIGVVFATPDGFGLISLAFFATAMYADPLTDKLYVVLTEDSEPTEVYLPLPSTAPALGMPVWTIAFQENFDDGLAPYSLISGTLSNFNIVPGYQGNGLSILPGVSGTPDQIRRSTGTAEAQAVSLNFKLGGVQSDDAGIIFFDTPTKLKLIPARELAFDPLQRAYLTIESEELPVSPGILAADVWFNLRVEFSSGGVATATLTNLDTGQVIQTTVFALTHFPLTVTTLNFYRDSGFVGTRQTIYDNIIVGAYGVRPAIYEFDAKTGNGHVVYRWRGKLNLLPHPSAFAYCKVEAEEFTNLVLNLYGDGDLLMSTPITSEEPFTLPMTEDYHHFEVELIGTSRVRTVQVSNDVMELT